jgi:hypothetical protein
MEAQQFSAFIILPLIALVVVQVAGLLVLQTLSVVVISGIFFLASYLVLGRLAVRFNREKIIEHL